MIAKTSHLIGLIGFAFCLVNITGSNWSAALARLAYFMGSLFFAVLVAADWLEVPQ